MFQKIPQNRMYENIANQVLEAMSRGDLNPGDKLPSENELTDIFGVSRATVREAIRSLEQFGVIVVRQGSRGGAYVKEMDLDAVVSQVGNALKMTNVSFPHLAAARASIEREILRELVPSKVTPEYCDRLDRNVDEAETHFLAKDNHSRLRTNFGFHTLLAELTENPIIILMHKVIVDLSISFFDNVEATPAMVKKTLEHHRKIASYLRKGELESAAEICFEHIEKVSATIVEKSKKQSLLVSRRT